MNLEAIRAILARPILNLHGGYSCPRCAGAIGGRLPLSVAPLCKCPMTDEGDVA